MFMMAFNKIQATRFLIFQFWLKWEKAAVSPTKGIRTISKKNKKQAVQSDLILKRKATDEEL